MSDEYDRIVSMGWGSATSGDVGGDVSALRTERDAWKARAEAPTPLEIYYASEYHRRNMQVARVCGARASVDQALARALTVKSIPVWLIAYLESAANRLPGLQTDLAAWRDLAPDAPETVRADLCANAQSRMDQESLAAAREDAREAEAYAEELEAKLRQEVKDKERVERVWGDNYAALEAKLAKVIAVMHLIVDQRGYADDPWGIVQTALAELKGETNGTEQ